ncbi:MAG: AAA family ATPase [Bacilli bacterium]|nr:AAA family ATPase [Bacilli bacterium]
MKTLIMLSAFPASGKSTWAKKYKETHNNVVILNSDEIRMEVTHGDYLDHSHQKEVWELFERRIHENAEIENVTVILDALNDVNEVRLTYLTTTPEFDKKILVMFPSNLEKSQRLNGLRDPLVRVPENILIDLYNKFEEPNEEVYNNINEIWYVYW